MSFRENLQLRENLMDFLNKNKESPLEYAVRIGELDEVKKLLANNADVNQIDPHTGRTAIYEAISFNSFTTSDDYLIIMQELLANKADVNVRDFQQRTPLHFVCNEGLGPLNAIDLVRELLKYGADVNAVDKEGKTPLLHAILQSRLDVIKELLTHKADVNIADNKKNTALHTACYQLLKYNKDIDKEIVKYLLANGANINSPNYMDETPRSMIANEKNYRDIEKLFNLVDLKQKNLEYREKRNANPLEYMKTLTIFGHTFNFGKSKTAKIAASDALNNVLAGSAVASTLTPHLDALEDGELGKIYSEYKQNI